MSSAQAPDSVLETIAYRLVMIEQLIEYTEEHNLSATAVVHSLADIFGRLKQLKSDVAKEAAAVDEQRLQLHRERAAFHEMCRAPGAVEPDSVVARLMGQSESVSGTVRALAARIEQSAGAVSTSVAQPSVGFSQRLDALSEGFARLQGAVDGLPSKETVATLHVDSRDNVVSRVAAAVEGLSFLGDIKDKIQNEVDSLKTSVASCTDTVAGFQTALLEPLGDAKSAFESGLGQVSRRLDGVPEAIRAEMEALCSRFADEVATRVVAVDKAMATHTAAEHATSSHVQAVESEQSHKRRRAGSLDAGSRPDDARPDGDVNVAIREVAERCRHLRVVRAESSEHSLSDATQALAYFLAREDRARKLQAFFERGPVGLAYCPRQIVTHGENQKPQEAVNPDVGCKAHKHRCSTLSISVADGQRTLEICYKPRDE